MDKPTEEVQSKTNSMSFKLVLIFIVGLALGVLSTWLYLQRYIGTDTSSQLSFPKNTKSSSVSKDPNAGYFVIRELGVRFKTNSKLDGLTYLYRYSGGTPTVYFSSVNLTKASPNCAADVTSAGALSQLKQGDKVFDTPVEYAPGARKIGDNYYLYQHAQGSCSDKQDVIQQHVDLANTLQSAVQTLEPAI